MEGMGAWGLVENEENTIVINKTWALKWKQFHNVAEKKFKANICACWDQQLEGIDFFETDTPNVQWTTA
ncbi:hypothetical protein ACHAXS_000622 [Conticribra weissflogii]